jgi:hypothetical protein
MKKELHIIQRRINNLQTVILLIINGLTIKPLAIPLAKNQTSKRLFTKFRLRIQTIFRDYANVKPLSFSHFVLYRLQYRLQSYQLRLLTYLQVQEDYSLGCKEKSLEDQSINRILFAGLFATHSN